MYINKQQQPLTMIVIIITIIVMITKVEQVESMIYDKDITISGKYYLIDTFGFDKDGSISLQATIQQTASTMGSPGNPLMYNITFWVCQDKDYQSLIGSSPSNSIETKLCSDPEAGNCPVRDVPIYNDFKFNYTVPSSDMYRLILLKCSNDLSFDLSLQYTLKNPSGHLPRGYTQLPSLYMYMTILMVLLFLIFNYSLTKNRTILNEIHYILLLVLVLKLILLFLTLQYYKSANINGTYNMVTKYLQNIIFSLEETTFFGILLLVSKGWRITRSFLPIMEIRTMVIILVLLLSVLLFFSFYNDVYYFLSLMILYFFMMPKIFTNITKNLRTIDSHIVLSRYSNNNMETTILYDQKIKLYRNLRTSVVLYLGAIIIINSMRIIMVWFLYWVTFCVSEPMSIIMLAFLCYLFRPYHGNPVFSNSNLDSIRASEISRSIENMINEALDPLALSMLFDASKSNIGDPKNCIVVNFPNGKSSLAVLEPINDNDNENNNNSNNGRRRKGANKRLDISTNPSS